MKATTLIATVILLGAAGAGGYALYSFGMNRGMQMGAPASGGAEKDGPQKAGEKASNSGRKVLYWQDPMSPGKKFDKPGKSPFMDMQLVPVYAGDGADEGGVSISPRVQQNLGVRTAEVTRGSLSPVVETVGSVAYNERDVAVVQARANGFVEKLHARAPLDRVRKGQALAELYVPDWVAAQEEYLSVKRMGGDGLQGLVDGARQRMRLAGMGEDHIRAVESSGKVQPRATVVAPIGGVITELTAREGMTVMAGAPLFRINGLTTVWVNAEVRENQAGEVRPGATVEARTPSVPGTVFKGKVSAILPEVSAATRTIKARVELANPRGELIPGMFATVNLTPAARREVLLVPSEAVIQTGKRSVVFVVKGPGSFVPADVETGVESGGQTEIRKGLEAGQKVVVSGQFLVDSEATLKGTTARMSEAPAAGANAPALTHRGQGKVESIAADEVMLSHGPITSLQWGAMTMGFKPPSEGMPKNVTAGDSVEFEFRAGKDGQFELVRIAPSRPGRDAQKSVKP